MSETKSNSSGGFHAELGLFSAVAIVMGNMIGSGIFIVPAEVVRLLKTADWLIYAWLLSGIITVLGAYSYSRLAVAYPYAGGQYIYLKEAWGKWAGFLYGWALLFIIQTGCLAAVAVAFSKFLGVVVPWVSQTNVLFEIPQFSFAFSSNQLISISVILGLTLFNSFGVEQGAKLQNIFTILKVLAVLVLIGLGLTGFLWADPFTLLKFPVETTHTDLTPITDMSQLLWILPVALVGPLFSSDSWNNVTFIGSEIKSPEKTIPKALLIGTVSVVSIYLLANVSYLLTLPIQTIANAPQDRVATLMIEVLIGKSGAYLMAGAILISTFGCLNGTILAGARVVYAMAKDNLFFKPFAKLHPTSGSPNNALWVQGLWAAILTLTGSYLALLNYIVFAVLIFYFMTVLGSFILAKSNKLSFSNPLQIVASILYCAFIIYLCVVLGIQQPAQTLPGLGIILGGIPIYFIWQFFHQKKAQV